MNELATQASNGTNSESDRQAIQDEISQLTTEIDRVSETTKFNETYLLKGNVAGSHLQKRLLLMMLVWQESLLIMVMVHLHLLWDLLKDGDSVSIGGKTYTIGSKKDDVVAAVTAKIKNAGEKFTVNGQEITITAKYTDADTGDADKVAAGKAADQKAGKYTLDDAKALVKEGATVKVGTDEYKVMTDNDANQMILMHL